MIRAFTIGQEQPTQNYQQQISEPEEVTIGTVTMDFSKLINGNIPVFNSSSTLDGGLQSKKRKRKEKNIQNTDNMIVDGIVTDVIDSKSTRELGMIESNEPYSIKYSETDNMLRSAVAQIDISLNEVHADIEDIRASKSMRSKYTYLSNLQGAMGGLISNKIAAARELNNTITKCQDLELRRYKEVKISNSMSEQDDNRKVQEMYKAFVQTPVGTYGQDMSPSMINMTVPSNNIIGTTIGSADQQFTNYLSNLTPAQNMMVLESNPNIKQVVVYNQETGARYFDVIDMSTGESIPNTDKHDSMFLEDVTINLRDGIATNTNLGETYPLVVVGNPILSEY